MIAIPDRTVGATSLKDGEVMLHLHRRVMGVDSSVKEPLNELNSVNKTVHVVSEVTLQIFNKRNT
jgi:hypothetical protein